jgi:hypothetical protein
MIWNYNGFVPVRRGLLEHLHDGSITEKEWSLYNILLHMADHKTGKVSTNAASLNTFFNLTSIRTTQRAIQSLEEKGYIKRPFFTLGAHKNQVIFINKFMTSNKTVLSFEDTTDWEHPAYLDVVDQYAEVSSNGTLQGTLQGTPLTRRDKEQGRTDKQQSSLQTPKTEDQTVTKTVGMVETQTGSFPKDSIPATVGSTAPHSAAPPMTPHEPLDLDMLED